MNNNAVSKVVKCDKIAFENYTQIMSSFVLPLMQNDFEIEKGKSNIRNVIK